MTSSANWYYFISYQTVCLLLPLLTLIDWLELPALYEVEVVGVYISVQFSSVAQSCQTLCDPMDCSIPDFPFHHQLLDPAQTHVHQVHDAIQPSHPLSSPVKRQKKDITKVLYVFFLIHKCNMWKLNQLLYNSEIQPFRK